MNTYYKRFARSKFNIIIFLLLLAIVSLSYYNTNGDLSLLESECLNPGEDFNISFGEEMLDNYSGLSFFANFLFSTDFYIIGSIILILSFGAISGSTIYSHLQSGYGSMIITRQSYSKYLKNLLISQYLYISTWVFGFAAFLFIASLFWDIPTQLHSVTTSIGILSMSSMTLMALGELCILCIYLCFVITITNLLVVYFKNKYLLQLMPFIIYFTPHIIGSIIGNINNVFARLVTYFDTDYCLLMPMLKVTNQLTIQESILLLTSLPILLILIALFLLNRNLSKFKGQYLI